MEGIPPAHDTDVEDVAWALQTAEALWKRNERGDAIVWLRRAAQAAGEANDDDRAYTLARDAAELTEWIARSSTVTAHSVPPASDPGSSAGVEIDSLLRSSHADTFEVGSRPVPPPFAPSRPPPLPPPLPPPHPASFSLSSPPPLLPSVQYDPTIVPPPDDAPDTEPPAAEVGDVASPSLRAPVSIRVLSAAESHAGMLDPWSSEGEEKKKAELARAEAPLTSPSSNDTTPPVTPESEDEVVTSAQPVATPPPLRTPKPAALGTPAPPKPAPPRPLAKPPAPPRPKSQFVSSLPPRRSKVPPPESERTRARLVPPPLPPPETPALFAPTLSQALSVPATEPELFPLGTAETPKAPGVEDGPLGALDLSGVDAFADLPDDAREALARGANLRRYEKGEPIRPFELAYVLSGEVDVSAVDVAVVATTIGAGGVLRARGSLDEPIALRLVCASKAVVATWDGDALQAGLGPCPWVEDDLRSSADRVQALAGATLGALGQRLSVELRTSIVERLAIRIFAEHEAIVTEGVSVPGLLLIGAGRVNLVSDDTAPTQVGAGEFVLAAQALSAGASPATVRAAQGGALVLVGDRKTTQELFATEPLLLEIFAGW